MFISNLLDRIFVSRVFKKEEKLDNNARAFCYSYCSPTNKWKIPIKGTFSELFTNYNKCNKNAICIQIKKLRYHDFLKTPYWKTVSYEAKKRAGFKCMICSSPTNLRTHHKNYNHHGREIEHIDDDLVVLCDECHKKFHNIIKECEQ